MNGLNEQVYSKPRVDEVEKTFALEVNMIVVFVGFL